MTGNDDRPPSPAEKRRRRRWLALVAVVAVVLWALPKRAPLDPDLEGVWRSEWVEEADGSPKRRVRQVWAFSGAELRVADDDEVQELAVYGRPAPQGTPRRIELGRWFPARLIYEVDGDRLRVARSVRLGAWPSDFSAAPGDPKQLQQFRRVAADPHGKNVELRALVQREFGRKRVYPARRRFDEAARDFVQAKIRAPFEERRAPTPRETILFLVDQAETRVADGGLLHFFSSPAGDSALETIAALHAVGAEQSAAVFEEAAALFPLGEPPRDLRARRLRLEAFTLDEVSALTDLEERFLARGDDLGVLMQRYWEGARPELPRDRLERFLPAEADADPRNGP